jgi:hypothetical protein
MVATTGLDGRLKEWEGNASVDSVARVTIWEHNHSDARYGNSFPYIGNSLRVSFVWLCYRIYRILII